MKHSTKGLKSLATFLLVAVASGSAAGADLISAPMNVSPASGSIGAMFGQVMISWRGVTLEMDNRDKDALPAEYNYIDPSYLVINVNGEEITVNNTQMGGRIFTKVVQSSDEQSGGGVNEPIDMLFIDFPVQFPDGYIWWKGEVDILVKEGAVTTTSGEVNGDIALTYYFVETATDVTWNPEANSKFQQGSCEVTATWSEGAVTALVSTKAPFLQMEDAGNDDRYGNQMNASDYASIENGGLKFDFSTLQPGKYSLTLPEGAIKIGEDYINGEVYYLFTITTSTAAPEPTVSVLPDETGWFDGFGLKWGPDTAPYALASQYADEDGIINAEGLALITVKENGTDILPVLSANLVEYQEDENTTNYPETQLSITLEDIQMNVGSRYTLIVEPGLVNIEVNGTWVANEAVSYTFTLMGDEVFELPEPTVSPASGEVATLTTIEITWESSLGGLDLLNVNEEASPITVTFNGEDYNDFTTEFEWSDRLAMTEGAAGDIFLINFEAAQAGEYEIYIPEGYFQVSDVDKGSYDSQNIILTYTVLESSDGAGVIGLEVDAEDGYQVYDLNGVNVLNTSNASDIGNLAKGIYVVNGKKVVIK